jgi:putative ABC transport system ATP-binding protein
MIRLDNVTKVYRMGLTEIVALREVSFHIETGEMVSVTGPSGSGKSTMMNIVGCLDRPNSGRYWLDGVEVNNLSDDQLAEIRNRKIGFVFQSFNLLPRTTALANVELPLVYGGVENRRQRALEALDSVGLSHRVGHTSSELAGGEQQRVAIARALVNNPSIILADEPTGNLDTKTSREVMLLFQELNKRGITIVVVTHEPYIITYTQRTIKILDGQIEG